MATDQDAPDGGALSDSSINDPYDTVDASSWLAAVVANSDDAILSKDLNGIILTWNPGASDLFGYTAAEAIGRPITIIIPDDRLDEETTIIGKIRDGERVRHFETVRRRKDGALIDISLTVSPVRDGNGRIIGASKIARDVTEARLAAERQALMFREMSHRIKNLFSLTMGIVTLSARGASSVDQLSTELSERIAALARAHNLTLTDLAVGMAPEATTLNSLLHVIFAPYQQEASSRVVITGCNARIGSFALPSLALLLHELATNAAKYGALSANDGTLLVEAATEEDTLTLQWLEQIPDGYKVPAREGFGTHLEKASLRGLAGIIRRDWRPEGLAIEMRFPLQRLSE